MTFPVRDLLSLSKRRVALAATALTAVLPLAACSGGPDLHPGDAAVVDGHAITISSVDDFAREFCALEKPGLAQQGGALPMALMRSVAVEALVTDQLLPAFAKEAGIDLAEVRRGVRDQLEQTLSQVPDNLRAAATERFKLEGARQTVLQMIGQAAGASGDQATAAGAQIFHRWRADREVDIDPRFGSVDLDALRWDGANGSLSVPVDKSGATIDTKAAAALPADQRCGDPA